MNSSSNPKSTADRNKSGVNNDYIQYTLTTGSQWQTNSVNTTVPILIGEGVWIEKTDSAPAKPGASACQFGEIGSPQ